MSKVFDSVKHKILLLKLQDVGASASCIRWFHNYLSDRFQVVRINLAISSSLPVTCGVPQGIILGPLLFNIYVNDLSTVPQSCLSQSFVDDTKLYLSFQLKNKPQAVAKINKDLVLFRNWCLNNFLLLNAGKSKLMVFGSRQLLSKVHDFSVNLLGEALVPVESAKDLDLALDENLTFDEHIVKTVSSCMSILYQINRVKHAFDRQTLITVINSLVFSKLFYCSNVWSNTSQKNINKLQTVQNFACHIVSGTRKFDHVTPILKQLRWLPVAKQLGYRSAIMDFKCIAGYAPKYLSSKFCKRLEISQRKTRNCDNLNIPFCELSTGQRSFHYRTVKLWNALETNLKNVDSLNSFKRQLKTHLLKQFLNWYSF